MGGRTRAAPAPQQRKVQDSPAAPRNKEPLQIDDRGNINVTGNITGEQLRQAQEEARVKREGGLYQAGQQNPEDRETVADVQAREQQTLKNPRKAKRRGRRSLISFGIGGEKGQLG